ncbi:MAG: hypothetical protein SGJ18_03845 [Pseudomonadota bacterium]|nr:hypothetical protein [Pseudomonadota bacterium]
MKFNVKLIIAFLALGLTLLMGFQNCSKFTSLKSDEFGSNSQSSVDILLAKEVFRTSVYAVTRKNCAGCHSANQQPLFAQNDLNLSYEISKAGQTSDNRKYADFENVLNSYFIEQSKNNHCRKSDIANAQFCTSDGSEMSAALVTWAAYEKKNGANPPPPKGGTTGVRRVIRLETRSYVATTLNEIFGPVAAPLTKGAIADNVIQFGGPCDSYSFGCSSAESQAAIIPGMTSPRAALVYRTCDKILSNDGAVEFARGLAGAGSSTVLPTAGQISNAYGLFYVGRTAPVTVTTALQSLVNQTTTLQYPTIEGWRSLFLTLCHAQDWQVP